MKKHHLKLFLAIALLLATPSPSLAQSSDNPPPLRRVTLYKHGVGYFERRGKVNGDEQVTFSFDAAQMNDVLKSLVVLDLSKGKIGAVTFDSTKPLDKRLENFGVQLDATDTAGLTALLGQLKGTRVELKSTAASTTGAIVGLERHAKTQGAERSETQELVLVSEGGELRSIPLDQIRGIKLLDARLRDELDRYLAVLQSTIHKNARHLTISATGQGERDLFISYIVEAPVWKTTYRVVLDSQHKPLLQGWAVVDNTQDEDWTNVSLSLVAGMPVSFIQDLQQPIYKRRPVIGMPDDYSLTPQMHEAALNLSPGISPSREGIGSLGGVVTDAADAVVAGATVKVVETGTRKETTTTTNSYGRFTARNLPTGNYQVRVESPGFKQAIVNSVRLNAGTPVNVRVSLEVGAVSETVTIQGSHEVLQTQSASISRSFNTAELAALPDNSGNLAMALADIEAGVNTQEIGELFEYRIDHPVTIKRNSSALIPIVQSAVEGESVSLYNARTLKQHPMSALYLNNTTGLTLETGPITVIENDTYAGEALTGRIKPGENRFITYAVDLGCRVSTKEDEQDQNAFLTEIINGEFRVHYKQAKTMTYTLTNVTDHAKTVYIEHPVESEEKWKLVSTPKPVETTENFQRFKVSVAPRSTAGLKVNEELPDITTYRLSNLTSDNIALFVKSRYLSPQMKQALDGILDLKAQIAALDQQLRAKQQDISTVVKDQERMRENLRALGKSDEERQLLARYVAKISQGEDRLEKLRGEEKELTEQRAAWQRQLDETLRKLAQEHRLSS